MGETLESVVSIHAPARGATSYLQYRFVNPLGFNPRARAGRDKRIFWQQKWEFCCFNPRARAGRDLLVTTSPL